MQQDTGREIDVPVDDDGTPDPETPADTPSDAPPGEGEVVADDDQEDTTGEVLEAQVAEWKNLALRATADLDNFRKRIAREKEEALRYANRGLLEELLPVLDNFEMGLQAASREKDSMVFQGMQMVRKQLEELLANHGVREVPADGQPFDPNVHEAVSQEPTPEVPEGTVVKVVRRGFFFRDRLLRPANVVVAKAPDAGQ